MIRPALQSRWWLHQFPVQQLSCSISMVIGMALGRRLWYCWGQVWKNEGKFRKKNFRIFLQDIKPIYLSSPWWSTGSFCSAKCDFDDGIEFPVDLSCQLLLSSPSCRKNLIGAAFALTLVCSNAVARLVPDVRSVTSRGLVKIVTGPAALKEFSSFVFGWRLRITAKKSVYITGS